MSAADNSGPAFPAKVSICRDTGAVLPHQFGNNEFCATGMSLRDYFAAKAMQGVLTNLPKPLYGPDWQAQVAHEAYSIADAMLAVREGV